MFQTKTVDETTVHILCSITYLSEINAIYRINVQEYCRSRPATDDHKIQRIRFACWITKVTDTHSECVLL